MSMRRLLTCVPVLGYQHRAISARQNFAWISKRDLV
jgi:hypothetical protein